MNTAEILSNHLLLEADRHARTLADLATHRAEIDALRKRLAELEAQTQQGPPPPVETRPNPVMETR
jgi:BMFP domain-containing protein YqiC